MASLADAAQWRRLGAVPVVGCLITATALLAAACTHGGAGSTVWTSGVISKAPGAPSTISAALAAIPRTSWDASYIEFGDTAQVEQLFSGSSQWSPYPMLGESAFRNTDVPAAEVLGFDPRAVAVAVTVGTDPRSGAFPDSATILYGSFDTSSVGASLSAAGFKDHGGERGGRLWAIGDNGRKDQQNPTGDPYANVIEVFADRIVVGGSTAEVEAVAAPVTAGNSLAANPALAALAACLGATKSGLIGPVSPYSPGTPRIGVGLVANSATDTGEELCDLPPDPAKVPGIEVNWSGQINNGYSDTQADGWSFLFTDPRAETTSTSPAVVRLSAHSVQGAPVGVLCTAYQMQTDDIATLTTP